MERYELMLGYLNEARSYFRIPQQALLKIGNRSNSVNSESLNRKSFSVGINEEMVNNGQLFQLRATAWHEIAHVRNWLNKEPVISFEKNTFLNYRIIDEAFIKRLHHDIPWLLKKNAFKIFLAYRGILSDKFVF